MAALVCPRFDYSQNVNFRWQNWNMIPFAEVVGAKRASKIRSKGTPEVNPIASVTNAHTRHIIIDKIIPNIVYKWPRSVRDGETPTVFIQQDNTGHHIGVDDPEFMREATAVRLLQIKLIMQLPMSPALNILDLDFSIQFNSIPALPETLQDI